MKDKIYIIIDIINLNQTTLNKFKKKKNEQKNKKRRTSRIIQ